MHYIIQEKSSNKYFSLDNSYVTDESDASWFESFEIVVNFVIVDLKRNLNDFKIFRIDYVKIRL